MDIVINYNYKDIVYTYSIIYDGYWKNGKLIDGTSTYFEDIGYYKSYDAK